MTRPNAPWHRSRLGLRLRWLAATAVVGWTVAHPFAVAVGNVDPVGHISSLAAGTSYLVVEPPDRERSVEQLIASSHHTVDVAMYEMDDPRIQALLIAAHRRGVVARVLLDRAGPGAAYNAGAFHQLRDAGVAVRWAPPDVIFHEKSVTADGSVAAVMTGNLVAGASAGTRDFAVVVRSRADVSAIDSTFSEDWGGLTVRTGSPARGLVWSPGAQPALVALVDGARRSLAVEAEEMGSAAVLRALERAARRGVRVEIVMSEGPRWGADLHALSVAGASVRVLPASSGTVYIHAKVVVVDGTTAFVGSQNLSDASLWYDRELGVVTDQPSVVRALSHTIDGDAAGAARFVGPSA